MTATEPMTTYYHVPPDLFYGDTQNVLLHLDYRYNAIPIGPISSMQVESNDAYLGSVPLVPGKEASRETSVNLAIPVVNLRPFSNSMRFRLTFQLLKSGNCQDTVPANLVGSILRSSYIDLRGLPHWAAMPNLELFSNAGFPFTRYADLSQTTIVLPDQPSLQEVETYLTMMGHFGAETGYPAIRVTVAGPDVLQAGANEDFLVITTGLSNGAVGKLAAGMPVTFGDNSLKVQDTRGFFSTFHNMWWKIPATDQLSSGRDRDDGCSGCADRGNRIAVRERANGGAGRCEERRQFRTDAQGVSGEPRSRARCRAPWRCSRGRASRAIASATTSITSGFCRGGRRWVCGSCRCRGWSIWWCWRSALCLPSGYGAGCERKRGGAYW